MLFFFLFRSFHFIRIKHDNDMSASACLIFSHVFNQEVPCLCDIRVFQLFQFLPGPNHVVTINKQYFLHPSSRGFLLRYTSYKRRLAATDAFRDVTCPFIGRLTVQSHFFNTKRPIPFPSLPMTTAIGIVPSSRL